MRVLLLAIVALAFTVQTARMTAVWNAGEAAIWAQAVKVSPHRSRALLNAGVACASVGDFASARLLFGRTVTAAANAPAWDRYILGSAVQNLGVLPFIEKLWARQHRPVLHCGVA